MTRLRIIPCITPGAGRFPGDREALPRAHLDSTWDLHWAASPAASATPAAPAARRLLTDPGPGR